MPGKVNPVMAEALMQVCAQVIGNDAAIALGGLSGNFELNVMMPVMAHDLFDSIFLLTRAVALFSRRLVRGVKANEARCRQMVESSLAMATVLAPRIGYDRTARIVREALDTGETIQTVARRLAELSDEELNSLLDPGFMIAPSQ
jgi:fumarate hydratase, class II